METIQGKMSLDLNLIELKERLAGYNRILLDLGTGDGRYAHFMAEQHPCRFVIGVDACRENLRERSRVKLPNVVFVIASAQNLPRELNGLITHLTINFPWGSLLDSLLSDDPRWMNGLLSMARPGMSMEVRLNSGALEESGWALEAGVEQIQLHLLRAGWTLDFSGVMNVQALRTFPSTWARRLAHGRAPQAMVLRGHWTH